MVLLVASLAIVPYTLLVLGGYEPPATAPYWRDLFPSSEYSGGDKLVLVLASAFSLAVTVLAWRGLLHRAREDRKLRETLLARKSEMPPPPPPGYQ